jgi:hypothetical protein
VRKLLDRKIALGVITVACFITAYLVGNPYAAFLIFAGLFPFVRLMRRIESERNWKLIHNCLSNFEAIIGGKLWCGRDAEIVASDRLDIPSEPGPIRFEHICRTKSGSWFTFMVEVYRGRVVFCELYPCDEMTARYRLERHQLAYIRYFGEPSLA